MGSTGKGLFVSEVDTKAKWTPHHTWVRIPSANWETEGYRSVTWLQFAQSVNKIAHWLDETLGVSVDNDTVAYLGANDIRYSFLFTALNKTKRKFLVPDGRVTKDGICSLLKETHCKTWLYSEDSESLQAGLGLEETTVKLQLFPSLEWCLDAEEAAYYPYDKTYEDAKHDEILIIHTSGTTGPPKPIIINNGFWAAGSASALLSRRNWPRGISTDPFYGRTMIVACPMRWNAGLVMTNMFGIFDNACCVLPPPDVVGLPAEVFTKLLHWNRVEGLIATPHTVVELFGDQQTQESLKSLEFVTYLGAALDQAVGDVLCEHTRLNSVIGSTETGGRFSFNPRDRKLWYSYDFIPESFVRMVRLENSGSAMGGSDESDVYQMFVDRPPGGEPALFQCAFWNFKMFEDVDRIDTKELWKPVRDSDGSTRWQFVARSDDWVKLIWMAKFNAQDIETKILRYPGVKHVMVGGTGRAAPYVIIEAKDELLDSKDPEELLDDIYESTIVRVNAADAKEISIPRETVFLAQRDKPFKLNLKQLILRREVEKDYEEDIEAAYKKLEKTGVNAGMAKFLEFMK